MKTRRFVLIMVAVTFAFVIARLFYTPFHPAGFVLSIIGAIILLFIWGKLS